MKYINTSDERVYMNGDVHEPSCQPLGETVKDGVVYISRRAKLNRIDILRKQKFFIEVNGETVEEIIYLDSLAIEYIKNILTILFEANYDIKFILRLQSYVKQMKYSMILETVEELLKDPCFDDNTNRMLRFIMDSNMNHRNGSLRSNKEKNFKSSDTILQPSKVDHSKINKVPLEKIILGSKFKIPNELQPKYSMDDITEAYGKSKNLKNLYNWGKIT